MKKFFEWLFYRVFWPGMYKLEVRIHNKPVGYVWVYQYSTDYEVQLASNKYLGDSRVRSFIRMQDYVNFLTIRPPAQTSDFVCERCGKEFTDYISKHLAPNKDGENIHSPVWCGDCVRGMTRPLLV